MAAEIQAWTSRHTPKLSSSEIRPPLARGSRLHDLRIGRSCAVKRRLFLRHHTFHASDRLPRGCCGHHANLGGWFSAETVRNRGMQLLDRLGRANHLVARESNKTSRG